MDKYERDNRLMDKLMARLLIIGSIFLLLGVSGIVGCIYLLLK